LQCSSIQSVSYSEQVNILGLLSNIHQKPANQAVCGCR
jgi:hypothetical protein